MPLAGCVSAVDDTSAFGFASAPSAAASESAEAATGPAEGTDGTPSDVAQASADAPPAALSEKAEPQDAAASAEDTLRTEGREIAASGRTTVAAYAGGTVSDPAGGNAADKTLFTSLFAKSQARTPIANADNGRSRRVILRREGAPTAGGGEGLPGVDPSSLFEIGQRASASDSDALDDMASYQVASLSGMARLAPNGLLQQREDVQTHCFDQRLVGMLRAIEQRFGSKVIVTSGYRSPSHNRRVNGARHSQHMACKAADIIVPNADNLAVAAFVRTMPGRGGVGTYCHTKAIHVDTGPQRDWNWQCRRRGN